MEVVILVIHVFLAVAIIGVILLQPPESSGLGGLGGSNPMAGVGTRGQANLLTRTTAILATCFIITSLVLAILAGQKPHHASILDEATVEETAQPAATETKEAPAVPLSK